MLAAMLENMNLLGRDSVDAGKLAAMAAANLNEPAVQILSARATEITFPMANMTTGGLWRVEGTARAGSRGPERAIAAARFSMVVKLVQSPLLWRGIEKVPPSFRDGLVRYYPWRTEVDVYASDLALAMPTGGRLPQIYNIEELDGQRAAIWMEDIAECPGAEWTDDRFRHAAMLLGRLAGSSEVRNSGPCISSARDADRMRFYLNSVGATVFMPGIRGEDMWKVPAVAEAADRHLIAGLRSLTDRAAQLMEEVIALPAFPAHGDASPQNLLIESNGDVPGGSTNFAVIDWGLYGGACAGFDLGQLLAGWVYQGAMVGTELYRLEPLCLQAYCEGLADGRPDIAESTVRRGHAASMAIFAGLQAIPTQRLAEPDSEELRALVAGRVEMARFVLDLLASTDWHPRAHPRAPERHFK
ncbi:phosphotransferase [Arthrobacter oryzae]|uniref:Phosphotransferase family enzyme n=1 Tax=Arthrobacter oryzae TaxID=409290 RepID=A0A495ENT2_9MICC|nr:phosphotransferase [Arthrobacter oryzae]RKR18648.1 phosphotransferase family enzyme [Arthrobacter oryzae]